MTYRCASCDLVLDAGHVGPCPACGHRERAVVHEAPPSGPLSLTEMPRVRPISVACVLVPYLGGQALFVLATGAGYRLGVIGTKTFLLNLFGFPIETPYPPVAHASLVLGALIAASCLGLLVTAVACCVLMYRGWAAIQDGCARTTPGLAVGLSLIPCVGAFWMFRALNGFAHDCHQFAKRHGIADLHVREPLYLWAAICILAGCIYLRVNWFSTPVIPQVVAWFLALAIIPEVCAAVTAIARAQERAIREAEAAAVPAGA